MDIQNHFYGHSAAYAAHAGLSAPRHIAGLVQHGWTPTSPVRSHFTELASAAPAGGLFVWSHGSRAWDPARDEEETGYRSTAIGAPFLYLADQVRARGAMPERTIPTVVVPFHGSKIFQLEGDQSVYARQVYEKEGPAVVCLHVDDMEHEEIVRAWTDTGHRVTTCGQRRDPEFLSRNLWLLASARKVVTNRVATASFYAAALGTPVHTYGPFYSVRNAAATDPDEAAMRAMFPEFFAEQPDQEALRRIAEVELGRPWMRRPEELTRLLGWDGSTLRPALQYWLTGPVDKALKVLGLRTSAVTTPQSPTHDGQASDPTPAPAVPNRTEPNAGGEPAEPSAGPKPHPLAFLRHPLQHLPERLPRSTYPQAVAPGIEDAPAGSRRA
ncbi:hypothetical protein NQ707_05610 [Rothia sp. BD8]|uniref:hypothetical protein n=1 Tax=Rothia sp. BD8 TaxID=2953894 RepID=UPI00383D1CA1